MNIRDIAAKAIVSVPGWVEQMANGGTAKSATLAYMASAWAARAVALRASAIPTAPLVLEDGSDEATTEAEPLDLLRNPNEEYSGDDILRYIEASVCVYGAAYLLKERPRPGARPVMLFPLNASVVTVKAGRRGIEAFEYTPGNAKHTYPREDVIYFRGEYDPASDLTGIAPLAWAARAALGDQAAESFMADFFANSAVPALLLSTDAQLPNPEVERVRVWWERLFKGQGKQHRTGIVGGGLKPYPLGVKPSDLALPDVRAAVHQTISTALGVPELLISPTNAADLTPVKIAQQLFYQNTILPRWNMIAATLTSDLLPEFPGYESSEFEFEYSDHPAFQEDADAKSNRLVAQVQAGIIRADVAARELGYEPEDVPEPAAPAPEPQPQPVIMAQPADQQMDAGEMETPATRAAVDLERWQRKALNALARGQSPAVPFASDTIGALEHARIRDALKSCADAGQVRAVFAGRDDYAGTLADEIKAARLALENEGNNTVPFKIVLDASQIKLPETVVNVPAPVVTVTVPETKIDAPVIQVNVPQQPAPVVTVTTPAVTVENTVNVPEGPREIVLRRDASGRLAGAELNQ